MKIQAMNAIKLLLPAILLLSSCAGIPLSVNEVNSLNKSGFNDLELQMDYEPTGLRIDVYRQYTTTYSNQYGSTEEPVAYHPVGMNLGNGLFFDLNGNLCLRIDQMLDFSSEQPFELRRNMKPKYEKGTFHYTFKDDQLSKIKLPGGSSKELYGRICFTDSTVFTRKGNFRFAIAHTDSSISYTQRTRKELKIIKINENTFYSYRRKKLREFTNENGLITLGKTFTIRLSGNKEYIEINTPNRAMQNKRPKLYLTKDEVKILIYSNNYHGTRIEFKGDGILVTGNRKPPILYEKIKKEISYKH